MKKSNFSESQIIGILRTHEQGRIVSDLCREHGISQATFYNWKGKYSGMDVSQLKQLKEMERDLSQYKRIVAELTLQNTVLKDVIEKKL
jgi:putative transposase